MPDDRYRRELTKLRRAELPDGLWERAQEGPRMAPLGPEPRSRVAAAVVAFAVFGLAAILAWQAFRPSHPGQPAGSNTIAVPPRGEVSAVFLQDGLESDSAGELTGPLVEVRPARTPAGAGAATNGGSAEVAP